MVFGVWCLVFGVWSIMECGLKANDSGRPIAKPTPTPAVTSKVAKRMAATTSQHVPLYRSWVRQCGHQIRLGIVAANTAWIPIFLPHTGQSLPADIWQVPVGYADYTRQLHCTGVKLCARA